jgi:hypothetical protein
MAAIPTVSAGGGGGDSLTTAIYCAPPHDGGLLGYVETVVHATCTFAFFTVANTIAFVCTETGAC